MQSSSPCIIVGLGNPGDRYQETRHNIGFKVVEALAQRHGIGLQAEKRFEALVGKGKIDGQPVLLTLPQTFMNRSGEAVARLSRYYHSIPPQILVIVDDTALAFGRLRYRPSGSAGTHNGLRSMVAQLGSSDFARLRVGVGDPPAGWDLSDYVLARFTPAETDVLPKLITVCADSVEYWLKHGTAQAMNQYNAVNLAEEPPKPAG